MEIDPEFRFLFEIPDKDRLVESHNLAKRETGVADFDWDSPLTLSTTPLALDRKNQRPSDPS